MNKSGTVVVLGTFDGVHKGHRLLILQAFLKAQQENKRLIIYTFSNHPLSLISKSPQLLMTANERIEALEGLGADEVVRDEFTRELSNMSPYDFALMLKERFNMTDAVAGYNYSFGKGGKGNIETLKKLGDELQFETTICEPVLYKGESVSSTRIRETLEKGDIKNANAMLEREYCLSGKVIKNKHIGTKIGFPTANIEVDENKVLPEKGVYATSVNIDGKSYNAVTNIGTNPTVNGKKLTIETHIIGFDGDIYGKELAVCFQDRIRDDYKFDSLDSLKAQIKRDISYFS